LDRALAIRAFDPLDNADLKIGVPIANQLTLQVCFDHSDFDQFGMV